MNLEKAYSLRPEPGDVLVFVVTLDDAEPEDLAEVRALLESRFPANPCLILNGLDLAEVHKCS